MKWSTQFIFLLTALIFTLAGKVHAASELYFDEGEETIVDNSHSVGLFIKTNSQTITALQSIIELPTTYLEYENIVFSDYPNPEYPTGEKPNCTHSLLPPDWGLVNKASPYVENHKIYISCGFTNPGYTTQGSSGDKLATITFDAIEVGIESISIDNTNTKYYYIGNQLSGSQTTAYQISVLDLIEPTPGPSTIPEKAVDSITEGDLEFVEIGVNNSSGQSGANTNLSEGSSELEVVEENNEIPLPPDDLPARATPVPLLERLRRLGSQEQGADGEVLSAQTLRELLIPGKSDADRRVVMVNLISILVFLIIIGILIWKYVKVRQQNKIKSAHLSELVVSELAAIESKLGSQKDNNAVGQEISQTIKDITKELSQK